MICDFFQFINEKMINIKLLRVDFKNSNFILEEFEKILN
jgi:hypothetical protein